MLRRTPVGADPFDPIPRDWDAVRDAAKEATLQQLITARAKVSEGRTKKFGFAFFNLTTGVDDELLRRFEHRLSQPKPLTRAETAAWSKAVGADRVKQKLDAKAQTKVRTFALRKEEANVETIQ